MFFTIHDPLPHQGENNLSRFLLLRSALKNYKGIFVHGKLLRDQLIKKYGKKYSINENNVFIIPHGNYDILKRWDYPNIIPIDNSILFFGRLEKYKGIEDLIYAFITLKKEINDLNLTIVGNGSLAKNIYSLSKKHKIDFRPGYLPVSEIPKLIRSHKCLVLPYRDASQSGVIPLAYTFSRPVIATNVGAIPEIVEDSKSGYLVAPKKPKKLADQIRVLLTDEKKYKLMCTYCNILSSTVYSWDKIAGQTINAMRNI